MPEATSISENTKNNFRILSLDGGGIKGAFTASVIEALEKKFRCRLADYFDLITGTSTGGILALGLGLGLKGEEITNFYLQHGKTIFPNTSLSRKFIYSLRHLFQPKHSQEVLKSCLKQVFTNKKFGDSDKRLDIPCYDANMGRIFILKTAHHKHFEHDYMAKAVDVALATSAAPTYFSAMPFPVHENASYIDGGVWANCPALVGLVDAVHFLKVPLENIKILSIGTTGAPFSVSTKASDGLFGWGAKIASLLMNAQQEAAIAQSMLLVGRKNFHRINFIANAGVFGLDKANAARKLVAIGRGEAVKKENTTAVEKMFITEKAEEFVPLITSN